DGDAAQDLSVALRRQLGIVGQRLLDLGKIGLPALQLLRRGFLRLDCCRQADQASGQKEQESCKNAPHMKPNRCLGGRVWKCRRLSCGRWIAPVRLAKRVLLSSSKSPANVGRLAGLPRSECDVRCVVRSAEFPGAARSGRYAWADGRVSVRWLSESG